MAVRSCPHASSRAGGAAFILTVIALELLANGTWSGTGVLGPEAFDAKPFLDLMALPVADGGYGQSWGLREQ